MQTKRKFAHEFYPHPEEGQTRPLAVEVPYLYARAIGMEVHGTDWHDLFDSDDKAQQRLAVGRTNHMIAARRLALIADALLQGLSGDEAWEWADQRGWDESGEWVTERAAHYGVPFNDIKPYPIVAEASTHTHWTDPDAKGWRTFIETVPCPESECPDCCEPTAEETQP